MTLVTVQTPLGPRVVRRSVCQLDEPLSEDMAKACKAMMAPPATKHERLQARLRKMQRDAKAAAPTPTPAPQTGYLVNAQCTHTVPGLPCHFLFFISLSFTRRSLSSFFLGLTRSQGTAARFPMCSGLWM